jgi:phosphopantetheinyl transferase (holo-ACP synthase)
MILGLGIDLVKISRIKDIIDRKGIKFLNRIYHPNEILSKPIDIDLSYQYFASR